ncbi:hypothetical protein KFE98_09010 [bacterium SCSIO 12741]|nr:hypothetical protein KFE98_09010 [bacterium SCSIO 12741]
MKSDLINRFTLLSFLVLLAVSASASHVAGGAIKYKYIGPGSLIGTSNYYIEVSVLRDCSGAQYNVPSAMVTAKCSSRNINTTYTLANLAFVAPTPAPFGGPYAGISNQSGTTTLVSEEVSDVCDKVLDPNRTPNTRCRGGTVLGFVRYKFSGIISLVHCNSWTLGFQPQCCRNTANSNINSGGMWVETRFDNLNFPTNSSPNFTDEARPRPNVCVGQTSHYSVAAYDLDKDSVTYNLACALQWANTCANYVGNFTYRQPAAGFSLDTLTGKITVKPTTAGKRVVAYWVKEYEHCTGRWKAQTLRDFQFIANICNNNQPVASSISNLTGMGATQLSSNAIRVEEGTWNSFKDTFTDPNSTDTVYLKSSLKDVFPQSSMTIKSISKNQSVATYTFFVSSTKIFRKAFFHTDFTDDRCNYPGRGSTIYTIYINNGVGVQTEFGGSLDTFRHCQGDTISIKTYGSNHYSWRRISGDTLVFSGLGQNVWLDTSSTDTNFQAHFRVMNPTQIELSGKVYLNCNSVPTTKRDTFWIKPGTKFTLNTSADTTLCFYGTSFPLTAQPNLGGYTYQYKWTPSHLVSNDTLPNPSIGDSLTATYTAIVSNNEGCIQEKSIQVETFHQPDSLEISAGLQQICSGDSVPLKVNLFDPNQSPFGHPRENSLLDFLEPVITANTPTNLSHGVGIRSWPCPFGTTISKSRQQYLYRKSDLLALGLDSLDQIYSVGFSIKDPHGLQSITDYSLKIGHVNDTSMLAWRQGLSTYHYSQSLALTTGWNYLNFNQAFQWDGNSNIVVEVCYDMLGLVGKNATVHYDTTQFLSSLVNNHNFTPVICNSQMVSQASNYHRPLVAFKTLNQNPSDLYQFSWSPTSVLSDSLSPSPKAGVQQTTTIQLAVQYKEGVCKDTANITLISFPDPKWSIGPDTSSCESEVLTLTSSHQSTLPTSYSWIPAARFADPTLAQVSFTVPKGTTQVVATLTDSLGCKYYDTLTVTGSPVPVAAISTFGPFCERDSINALIAQYPTGFFYGKAVDSLTGNFNAHHPDFLATYNHPDQTTVYYKAISSAGCVKDTSFQVRVDPVFDTTYTGNRVFCEYDSTVMLQAKHPGGTWSGPGVNGTHFKPYLAGVGTHSIRLDSNGYCGNSAVYSFYVNPIPSKAVPDSVLGCTGNPAVIDAGNPGSTYQWSNGKSSKVITETQSGTLQLITTDAKGCKRTDTIDVMVELICLGMTQIDLEKQIRAYPNPTSDRMVIEIPFAVNNPSVFWVMDEQGKQVMSYSIYQDESGQIIELDVQHLAIGNYRLVGMLDGNPLEISFQVSR